MKISPQLVLASSSPYRKSLLNKICPAFECAAADIDESRQPNENSLLLSERLAYQKANALSKKFPNHLIIGSDQVAMLNNQQLHKPGNADNAIKQLLLSSGKKIHFYTSVCVLNSTTQEHATAVDECIVHMKPLSLAEIEKYVSLDKPYGCAAAFKSEGLGIVLFEKIIGDDPNALVGLPLIKLASLLHRFDYKIL